MQKPIDLFEVSRPTSLSGVRVVLDKGRREGIMYFPSPADWRDEVLYFLLPDRFSDGKESTRALLTRGEIEQLRKADTRPDINWSKWSASGTRWQGGTIKGIEGKLNYLLQLGITTIWIAPVFKQRSRKDTYHGYGIQDFLDIDPRFGSTKEVIELVGAAHEKGIRIVFDVIINHSGDNWGYIPPNSSISSELKFPVFKPFPNFYGNPNDPVMKDWRTAWRNEAGECFTANSRELLLEDDGIWPRELQNFSSYTRAGKGSLDGNDLSNETAEHKRTDFEDLKDFALDVPNTLHFLSDCFKYWIALTDCDGFRIDTVKHISLEEARNFCGAILEFAESLGKRNFFLIGEIAGGDNNQDYVLDYMALLQRNLSAALDIGSDRIILNDVGRGVARAETYFNGFSEESSGFDSHRSFGNRHVSILNDHDQIFGDKLRFSALISDDSDVKDYHVVIPTAIQLFSLGIPCIYYGTEQAFSGPAANQIRFLENWGRSDRYLREAMFGPEHPRGSHDGPINTQLETQDTSLPGFGAFGTTGKHVFDKGSPSFLRIAALIKVRSSALVLRVGRQYYRSIRVFRDFELPKAGELVAWSRILDYQEAVCIINPNGLKNAYRGGDVIVSGELWPVDTEFTVVANTAQLATEAKGESYSGSHPVNSIVRVSGKRDGEPAYLKIRDVAPAEVLILLKQY